jgi:NAD(P)-dependent dehydrogenase (short-subunit alcohol dehydrogenase family)
MKAMVLSEYNHLELTGLPQTQADRRRVEYLVERIPLKRPGAPNDLDGPIVFLASEASRYRTGQTMLIDGGISTGAMRATVKT